MAKIKLNISNMPDGDKLKSQLTDAFRETAVEAISKKSFKVSCPRCGSEFMASKGVNACPGCGNAVDVKLNIKF